MTESVEEWLVLDQDMLPPSLQGRLAESLERGLGGAPMRLVPIRLGPGTDLRLGPEQLLIDRDEQAGCVISGIGSLSTAHLQLSITDGQGLLPEWSFRHEIDPATGFRELQIMQQQRLPRCTVSRLATLSSSD